MPTVLAAGALDKLLQRVGAPCDEDTPTRGAALELLELIARAPTGKLAVGQVRVLSSCTVRLSSIPLSLSPWPVSNRL